MLNERLTLLERQLEAFASGPGKTRSRKGADGDAKPIGTNRLIGASASSITRQMAISGACCEAASNAHAPSSAYMPIEFVWNICIHRMPSTAPPEAPNAMPGCSTPPEAPERIVSNVTIALAPKRQQQNRNDGQIGITGEAQLCRGTTVTHDLRHPNRHDGSKRASQRHHP